MPLSDCNHSTLQQQAVITILRVRGIGSGSSVSCTLPPSPIRTMIESATAALGATFDAVHSGQMLDLAAIRSIDVLIVTDTELDNPTEPFLPIDCDLDEIVVLSDSMLTALFQITPSAIQPSAPSEATKTVP